MATACDSTGLDGRGDWMSYEQRSTEEEEDGRTVSMRGIRQGVGKLAEEIMPLAIWRLCSFFDQEGIEDFLSGRQ